jgi:hypothetical protein
VIVLHSDSKRRLDDIAGMVTLFKTKGYTKTAEAIIDFSKILEKDKLPDDVLDRLDFVFNVFEQEFIDGLPVGKDYRFRCITEIKGMIFKAVGRTFPDTNKALIIIFPLVERLKEGKMILNDIAPILSEGKMKDRKVLFYIQCYAYIVTIEGIFDELARILYFLSVVSKNDIPEIQKIQAMGVWDILEKLGKTVFLENWSEKNHIRNAIGHARASFDLEKNQIRFVDIEPKSGKTTYDQTKSLESFIELALQLEDSVEAFVYTMTLLRLYDLIVASNPYLI